MEEEHDYIASDVISSYVIDDKNVLDVLLHDPCNFFHPSMKTELQATGKICCELLRHCLRRDSYHGWWNDHPNCSFYNQDNGCILLQPIHIPGIGDIDHVFDCLADFISTCQVWGVTGSDGEIRFQLYNKINDAIGGPTLQQVINQFSTLFRSLGFIHIL